MRTSRIIVEQFSRMKSSDSRYYTVVIENIDQMKIVAMGTLLVELKLIRGGGSVH